MPKVFTGKVVIPGDQVEAYFEALAAAEEERRPFRDYLDGLNAEFEHYLEAKYSRRTARKHGGVVALFIHFLCDYTDVEALEEVTRGMSNSAFRQWYKRKVLELSERGRPARGAQEVLPIPPCREGHPQPQGAGLPAVAALTPDRRRAPGGRRRPPGPGPSAGCRWRSSPAAHGPAGARR